MWLIFLLSENLIPIYVIICHAIHAVVKYIVHTNSRYLSYLCNDGHNRFYRDFSVTIFFWFRVHLFVMCSCFFLWNIYVLFAIYQRLCALKSKSCGDLPVAWFVDSVEKRLIWPTIQFVLSYDRQHIVKFICDKTTLKMRDPSS
jgi:hypothetical protein